MRNKQGLFNVIFLLLLVGVIIYTVRRTHQNPAEQVIDEDGQRVLNIWDKYFTQITKPVEKKLQGNTELYGYFFAVNPKDSIEMRAYHFEERKWMIALSENFNEFFTEMGLARDFDRLWKFLLAVHNDKINSKSIVIKQWTYTTEPYVSVAFYRKQAGGEWYVWVKGLTSNPVPDTAQDAVTDAVPPMPTK